MVTMMATRSITVRDGHFALWVILGALAPERGEQVHGLVQEQGTRKQKNARWNGEKNPAKERGNSQIRSILI